MAFYYLIQLRDVKREEYLKHPRSEFQFASLESVISETKQRNKNMISMRQR
jgi:hypothetical protein